MGIDLWFGTCARSVNRRDLVTPPELIKSDQILAAPIGVRTPRRNTQTRQMFKGFRYPMDLFAEKAHVRWSDEQWEMVQMSFVLA